MRVAVIGSGISGLSSAYFLAPHADVVLYEKDSRIGGHTHTISVQPDMRHPNIALSVDTGFMVLNPPQYPELTHFLKQLNVSTVETDMSFSVHIPGEIEWASTLPQGLFTHWRTWCNPQFWLFLLELPRFFTVAKQYIADPDKGETIREFIANHRFSRRLVEWYLIPMVGAVWSCETDNVYDFPARELLQFLHNHNLLQAYGMPLWHTISGGSQSYIEALEPEFAKHNVVVRTEQEITKIQRTDTEVHITANDTTERFDWIVLATHADTALSLLSEPTATETDILGSFSYSQNKVVVHSDSTFMPPHKNAISAWNYYANIEGASGRMSLTYNMNILQHIDSAYPMYVTLNPHKEPTEENVYARIAYTHPQFPLEAQRARERLIEIQGKQRTLFTGAHWGYGFHEDGIVSSINALRVLNITPPWHESNF